MAEEFNEEKVLHRVFDQINEHVETRWEYFTLTATENMSGLAANLVGGIVVFVFSLLVLFFFTMGFAWWLGDYLNNRAGGFALTGLTFIPIAWLLFRWIRPFIQTKVIESMLHDEASEKQKSHE